MSADTMDPQAEAAVARQGRIPIPHSRRGLKLARGLTRPASSGAGGGQ
ncbi:hypothetical protein J2751_000785 [Halorubrum alkaliphilum]|uniref:Uncharacterized protein n=1 Tax=Halorubrum alkaliphilum TaxID=261290 RepID=A0A8T4GBI8_9EURY|nr:hypothetical protein [Halorubrum alkaliphilum]